MNRSYIATATNLLFFITSAIVAVVFIMPLVLLASIFIIPKYEN
jgi:hypothetical protein